MASLHELRPALAYCRLFAVLIAPVPSSSGEPEPVEPTVNKENFVLYWNELLKLQLMGTDGKPKAEGEGGDVMHLKDSHIFGREQELRHVYVRQSYVDLVGIIIRLAETAAPAHKDATARVQVLVR